MFTYRLTRLWFPSPNDLPIDDVFFLIIKLLVVYNSLQIYAKLLGVYSHLCRKHHFWLNNSHPLTLFWNREVLRSSLWLDISSDTIRGEHTQKYLRNVRCLKETITLQWLLMNFWWFLYQGSCSMSFGWSGMKSKPRNVSRFPFFSGKSLIFSKDTLDQSLRQEPFPFKGTQPVGTSRTVINLWKFCANPLN